MKHLGLFFLLIIFGTNCSLFNRQISIQDRYLVAVLPVENKTGNPSSTIQLKNIQNEIIVRMHETQKFRLIERERIDIVYKEISLAQRGIIEDKEIRVGKVLGVDAVLIPTLQRMDTVEKNQSYGTKVNLKNARVVVEMTGRLIHVKTGEILSVGDGKVEEERSEEKIEVFGKILTISSINIPDMQKNNLSIACQKLSKAISENYNY